MPNGNLNIKITSVTALHTGVAGNKTNQKSRTRGPTRNIASDVVSKSQQARNLKGLVLLMSEIAVIGRDISFGGPAVQSVWYRLNTALRVVLQSP